MRKAVALWTRAFDKQTIITDKLRRTWAGGRRAEIREALGKADKILKLPSTPLEVGLTVPEELELFAVFGHGTWRALIAGGYNRMNVYDLAEELAKRADPEFGIKVVLYSCSCGAGRGKYKTPALTLPPVEQAEVPLKAGFAMRLAGALAEHGVDAQVYAHLNRGKAAKNPFVVEIIAAPDETVIRREVVPFVSWWRRNKDPQGRRDWVTWRRLLADDPRFRFQFPFLTRGEIARRLSDERLKITGRAKGIDAILKRGAKTDSDSAE